MRTELWLWDEMLGLGGRLLGWSLALAHERLETPSKSKRGRAEFVRQRAKKRELRSLFGQVGYARDYLHRVNGKGGGYFPLDERLGLTADSFTMPVLSLGAQLATKMSYAAATALMKGFLGWAPSTKSLERAVLGLGAFAEPFAVGQPVPKGDGEVLIAQLDAKGHPTVRDTEMEKRRGEQGPRKDEHGQKIERQSQRHRGREKRHARGPKPRPKPGDKSKNAKMVHVIVIYTLKRDGKLLKGPINKRVYAYTGTKRGAVRRMKELIDRRGFGADKGKDVQVLSDGDSTYADEITKCLPYARHTLDMQHATEYLWDAAHMLHPSDAKKRTTWAEDRKGQLFEGKLDELLAEMKSHLPSFEHQPQALGKNGKRPKTPREKFQAKIDYLEPRRHLMNYRELDDLDLELATGIVEGACRYVVGQRFDEGGMRWLKEKAAPLLHLRTIELNGWWSTFIEYVHEEVNAKARRSKTSVRLLTNQAPPPPAEAAA